MIRFNNLLVGPVARLPWRVQTKLLIAFLAIVVLLVALGAVGLYTLSGVNQRTEELIRSERKIAAYRQVQHDTTSQLYSVTSALLVSDERTLDSALRQLNQFGYDLERLQFVAKDEIKLLGKVAQLRHVGVFPRFEVMRQWHEKQALPIDSFVIADGLHMNDWGYACFAQLLGDDIIRSVGQIKLGVNVPSNVQSYRPM